MDRSLERLVLEVEPNLTRLRELRTQVAKWLGEVGINGDVRDAVILATHEVAASLIAPPERGVEVEGTIEGRVIRLVIHGGSWMEDANGDGGGQRLGLVKRLMTDVRVETRADRTRVRLQKQF